METVIFLLLVGAFITIARRQPGIALLILSVFVTTIVCGKGSKS